MSSVSEGGETINVSIIKGSFGYDQVGPGWRTFKVKT